MFDEDFKMPKWGIAAIIVVVLAVLFRLTAVTRIPANTVGVRVSAFGGVQDTTLPTGYHLKAPFVDKIYKLSTSVQSKTMEGITTQTHDGQWLNTNIDVKYKVNSTNAMTVFKDYVSLKTVDENVISPAVQRAIESVTGEYDIYDVLGAKRTEVYGKIDKALETTFKEYNLEFVSFTITDQDAGDEIENAIKNESVKQKEIDTALQAQEKTKVEAETKKIEAQAEADAALIKAQGEADANKALSNSIDSNIIAYTEAQARLKHGWIEVQTSGNVITDTTK